MRVQKDENWIDIEFCCYATEEPDRICGLREAENAVSVQLDYELDGDWGSQWYEYVTADDLCALRDGLHELLACRSSRFLYTANRPYGEKERPFFTLNAYRFGKAYILSLSVETDGDPLFVEQCMSAAAFLAFVQDFTADAERFPPRR